MISSQSYAKNVKLNPRMNRIRLWVDCLVIIWILMFIREVSVYINMYRGAYIIYIGGVDQRCDTNPCLAAIGIWNLAYILDNFFLYANGNWMKNNPIPSGYPSWNSFMALRLKSQEDCKTILSELEEKLKE